MAPPNSSSFSVRVVLPASGWLMMAKVRLRPICADKLSVDIAHFFQLGNALESDQGLRGICAALRRTGALGGSMVSAVPEDRPIFFVALHRNTTHAHPATPASQANSRAGDTDSTKPARPQE